MRRMRTIGEAAAWAKEVDPETALSFTGLRRLVLAGEIPCVRLGRKRLIALEDLEAYLERGGCSAPPAAAGTIRAVNVR